MLRDDRSLVVADERLDPAGRVTDDPDRAGALEELERVEVHRLERNGFASRARRSLRYVESIHAAVAVRDEDVFVVDELDTVRRPERGGGELVDASDAARLGGRLRP